MGQARQRGTREQRVALAQSKPPKLSAEDRQRLQAEAMVKAFEATAKVLEPLLGLARGNPFR
jgi:hypothetical protein